VEKKAEGQAAWQINRARESAPLSVERLRDLVDVGSIDTVLVACTDMQGRLRGKRLHAPFFLADTLQRGTEGCNYLFAVDVDMDTVGGYAISSWERGYGDMELVLDLSTLRLVPWLPATAMVQCDLAWLDETTPSRGGWTWRFNNAGISPPQDASILDTDLAAWRRVQEVNLTSVYLCCKAVLPYMREQGRGSIINTASFVAVMGAATSQVSYSASKGGVLSMTRELGVQSPAKASG
jgi:hypothetical protein